MRRYQVPFLKSLVWRDLALNPGLPDHWRTLYPLLEPYPQMLFRFIFRTCIFRHRGLITAGKNFIVRFLSCFLEYIFLFFFFEFSDSFFFFLTNFYFQWVIFFFFFCLLLPSPLCLLLPFLSHPIFTIYFSFVLLFLTSSSFLYFFTFIFAPVKSFFTVIIFSSFFFLSLFPLLFLSFFLHSSNIRISRRLFRANFVRFYAPHSAVLILSN